MLAVGMLANACRNPAGLSLERDGLITPTVHATVPPRVDYELTETGRSLLVPLAQLRAWAESHVPEILKARDQYDDTRD